MSLSSSLNLLNRHDYSCIREEIDNYVSISPLSPSRRIIVANQLPLKANFDIEMNKWVFEYDYDSLVLQLKSGLRPDTECVYIGSLPGDISVPLCEQEQVGQFLLEKFCCVPTFLSVDIQSKYYYRFCKHFLFPTFHNMLPDTRLGFRFDRVEWQAYFSANKVYADKVIEVINPDKDYVWIHDYHLMMMPTLLRKSYSRIRVGFFLHSPFPSFEIFRTIPVCDELLRALLNCDLIGFHTLEYACHLLSCCSIMLGLQYECRRDYIGLEYNGRIVSIKILPVGVDMGQIESVKWLQETAVMVQELRERYNGKVVMLGDDDIDMFKGVSFKFLAFGKLLENHPEYVGLVVLIQILNPARSRGEDVLEVKNEIQNVASEVNRKFAKDGYEPIVIVTGQHSPHVKCAYYSVAECVVVNAVRDGMNLVAFKYIVSRQSNPELDIVLFSDEKEERPKAKKSVIIVSEFIGCSSSLSGAIRVNPWDIDSVTEAMNQAIKMSEREKERRHEKHYKYVSSHDVVYWAKSFDQDLQRACNESLGGCRRLTFE